MIEDNDPVSMTSEEWKRREVNNPRVARAVHKDEQYQVRYDAKDRRGKAKMRYNIPRGFNFDLDVYGTDDDDFEEDL